ncbi:chloride channel protein [Bauldia sp.]|uniref:chloride channel protein n=1 Tax=Bauldia sp. TaxID=2575872 RepID=UPI003BAAB48F
MLPRIPILARTFRQWTVPNLKQFADDRQPVVWLLAPLVGLATGIAAILFRLAIGAVQWPWLQTITENVAEAARAQPWWVLLLAPAVGGLVVGLILQYALTAKRTGAVPDVMEARIHAGRGLGFRQGLISAAASAVSLGSGASAGREGPIVHLGAVIGTTLCRKLHLPDAARRTLLACGVAGGVAASFNAPIAGVLFAQEVILGHFAVGSFVPLVLASVIATIVSQAWFGDVAAFTVPAYQITSYLEIPAFILLGVIAAVVAIAFQLAMITTDWIARNISMPLVARPVVGGLLIGGLAIWFPEVLGVGYDTTDAALKDELPLAMMLALIVAKTAATAIALASRFGGGVFSPALYLGAMTGGAFGLIAASVFPAFGSSEGLYAILGMGAVAAAVLGAPISTIVMVFELTGGFALSLALMLTVSIGNGLSYAVLGRSFFQAQLEARGYVVKRGPHQVLMKQIVVADFMTRIGDGESSDLPEDAGETVLNPTDTLETALRVFDSSGAERVPVVSPGDRDRLVGWATQVAALARYNKALIDTSVEEHQ